LYVALKGWIPGILGRLSVLLLSLGRVCWAGLAFWRDLWGGLLTGYCGVYPESVQHQSEIEKSKFTRQQLEGCWVELVDGGIDIYGCATFLACQPLRLLVVRHGVVIDVATYFGGGRALLGVHRVNDAQFMVGDHLQVSGGFPAASKVNVPRGKRVPAINFRVGLVLVAQHRRHRTLPANHHPYCTKPTHHPRPSSGPETLSHDMEPPAKRMRILQSVEVDEDNAEYIHAKQQQQKKFKGRLEALFEKYGNMHETMSDEIDMKSNSVVVDRGHLRRLKRQVGRKETLLLDTLGLEAGNEPEEEPEEEGAEEYSEDELAPTQPVKLNSVRTHTESCEELAAYDHPHIVQQPNTPAIPTAQFTVPQVPSTPNPTASLMQLAQFPQTPAGQQAQTAFYTALTQSINQTVNQAVLQAIVPLLTGLLPPNVQLPFAHALPAPTTPVATSDKVAPATDPKWFFPPLSAEMRKDPVAQSSPLAMHTAPSAVEEAVAQQNGYNTVQQEIEEQSVELVGSFPPMLSRTGLHRNSSIRPRRSSPRVEIQKKRMRTGGRKYHFTEAEDVYISQQRRIHQTSWAAIKNSNSKWKEWPLGAFHNHWNQLQHKNLHLKESLKIQANSHGSIDRVPESPARSHHLPTPSSLEQEDSPGEVIESSEEEPREKPFSSSAHFDDDDRDLLSLADADADEDQFPIPDDEGTLDLSPDEVIPSIETQDSVHENTLQRRLLDELPMHNTTSTPARPAPVHIKTEPLPIPSSPFSTRKRKRLPINFEVVSDSDAEDGEVPIEGESTTGLPFIYPTCQKSFKNYKNFTPRHQSNPRNTHNAALRKSASLDLVGGGDDDDLQDAPAPTTPLIKRETSAPPRNFLSAFQTPKALPRHLGPGSSGSKSTSKIDRKTYRKQVKQSWTRGATPAKSVAKRKSMGSLLSRKRPWSGDDGSEDELAM
jgi:hypothetical protein